MAIIMKRINGFLYWLSQRTTIVITLLIFSLAIIIIYFLVTGFAQTDLEVSLGIAVISTFLAALISIASIINANDGAKMVEVKIVFTYLLIFDSEGSTIIFCNKKYW